MEVGNIDVLDKEELEVLLEEYKDKKTSIITGKLVDETTKQAISGAIIEIFKKQKNNVEILTNLIYSNKKGYFVIETDSTGEYIIKINALGYELKKQSIELDTLKKIVICNISLKAGENEETSKITGQVTNKDDEFVSLAEVILYKVTKYGEMIPAAYEKTDENGNYEFINVPKGNYKIRAKYLEKNNSEKTV